MKFSRRSTYGLRAMARLAKNWEKDKISLAEISRQENISKKYLEQIFTSLKKAQLVKADKGHYGGYMLARDPKKISTLEIIEALEGKIGSSPCLGTEGNVVCKKGADCGVAPLFVKIQKDTRKVLEKIFLSEVEKVHK